LDLAKQYLDKEKVDKRWEEILTIEGEVMTFMELRGDRMH
jgi:tRNA-(ms[2]io[6]A)-hydroxylase